MSESDDKRIDELQKEVARLSNRMQATENELDRLRSSQLKLTEQIGSAPLEIKKYVPASALPKPVKKTVPPKPVKQPPPIPKMKPAVIARREEKPAIQPLPPEPAPKKKNLNDLETKIGTLWFNRLGLIAVLVGVGLLARWIHPQLQAWHKVFAGYLLASVLYAVGHFLDFKLKQFARPVMAGGIALAFFTSFAAHFVQTMACVHLWVSLGLMSASILALMLCAERWKSEPTAGFAIFLGHVAAFIAGGDAQTFSLAAILMLSGAAVLLFLRHNWLPLSLFSVAGAFSSHLLWSVQSNDFTSSSQAFWLNLVFLTSYYAIFLCSDLIYQRRLMKNGPKAFTASQKYTGRAIGPATLFLYTTLAVRLFFVYPEFWPNIHFFLMPFGVLQLAVTFFHLKTKNLDHPIYTTAGITFITLGLFSALDAMTLNMALAAEAMLLIVLSRKLKFWLLTPLAQCVLGVNFVHYWLSSASHPHTWPAFFGGLAVALVYLIKSQLEETQPAPETNPAFPTPKWVESLRVGYHREIQSIAGLHAAAGGIMAAHLCYMAFAAPWNAVAAAILSLPIMLSLIFLNGRSLIWTGWALQAGTGLMIVKQHETGILPEASSWMISQFAAFILILGALIHVPLNRIKKHPQQILFSFVSLILAGLTYLLIPKTELYGGLMLPAAFIGAIIFWILAERFGNSHQPTLDPQDGYAKSSTALGLFLPKIRIAFAVAAALMTFQAVCYVFSSGTSGLTLYPMLTGIVLVFAIVLKSPSLKAGLMMQIAFSSLYLVSHVMDTESIPTMPAWWTALSCLIAALALAFDFFRTKKRLPFFVSFGSLGCLMFLLHFLFSQPVFTGATHLILWITLLAGTWITIEILRLTKPVDQSTRNTISKLCMALSGLSMLLLYAILSFHLPSSPSIATHLMSYTIGFIVLCLLIKSPTGAVSAGTGLIVLHYLHQFQLGTSASAIHHPWLPILLSISTLAAGLMAEKVARTNSIRLQASWFCVIAALAYAATFYTVAGLLAFHPAFNFNHPSLIFPCQMLTATLLASLGLRFNLRVLFFAGLAYLGTLLGIAGFAFLAGAYDSILHMAGILMGLQLIWIERFMNQSRQAGHIRLGSSSLIRISRGLVMACAATLLFTFYLSEEFHGAWTTLSWSLAALFLMGFGFLIKNVTYRRTALVVFLIAIVRIVAIDIAHLELFYRMMVFFAMGLSLIAVSYLYTRFRDEIQKWI